MVAGHDACRHPIGHGQRELHERHGRERQDHRERHRAERPDEDPELLLHDRLAGREQQEDRGEDDRRAAPSTRSRFWNQSLPSFGCVERSICLAICPSSDAAPWAAQSTSPLIAPCVAAPTPLAMTPPIAPVAMLIT